MQSLDPGQEYYYFSPAGNKRDCQDCICFIAHTWGWGGGVGVGGRKQRGSPLNHVTLLFSSVTKAEMALICIGNCIVCLTRV